jgi:adenylate cyclase
VTGMGSEASTRAVVGRFSWQLFAIGSSLGALIGVYAALWSPLATGTSRPVGVLENFATAVVASSAVSGLFRWRFGRRLRALLGWLDGDRLPSAAERTALVRLPKRVALDQLLITTAIAVAVAFWNVFGVVGVGPQWARALVGIALFGLTLTALTYLLAERSLRPVYAATLTGEDTGQTVGVRWKLLLAWATGSGIPFLFIVAIPLRGTAGHQLSMSVPVVFMGLCGIVVGAVATFLSAGSVADPVVHVRDALQRVEHGDLDVELSVEDSSEIGQLQASFNSMTAGLRERQRLQDLFGRHVGEEVARKALDMGVHLGGEMRSASILFADLVGSTALAERHHAEVVVQVLNQFFGAVVDSVTAEAGWMDKFEGDAALAVFGVPLSQPDHAARALRTARALRAAAVTLGIDTGIGVATGEVVAGNIGTETRHEFTVIGRPVNQASRLADLAKQSPRRILVSLETVQAAGEEASNWIPLDPVEVKGVDRPIQIATVSI